MLKKVYFDTSAFAHFFLTKDEGHPYSPFPQKWKCVTSPFSIEEFFFNFITKGRWSELCSTSIEERIKKLKELQTFMAFFKIENVDLKELTNLFVRVTLAGLEGEVVRYEESRYGLDFYDLLHLSYSLLAETEIFITSDSDFKSIKVESLSRIISGFKLRKIEIFEPSPNFNKKVCTVLL